MVTKSEIWWASVGGNSCEPVRVLTENGQKVFYSIGCGDAHPLDGVVLVREADPPLSPKESVKERRNRDRAFNRAVAAGNYAYRHFS
jgi:hypothetical protein